MEGSVPTKTALEKLAETPAALLRAITTALENKERGKNPGGDNVDEIIKEGRAVAEKHNWWRDGGSGSRS